jgi:DNA-binding MarR family transcriptional regulator
VDYEQASAINAAIRAIGMRHRALAGALLAPLGLHPGQEVLLLELDAKGPRTQGQLAVACGCEPPTITNSVRRLEAAGLVVRRPSPSDGRATIVDLSEKGRTLMPKLRIAWLQLGEQTVTGVTTRALPELTGALQELAASLAAGDNPRLAVGSA